MGEAGRTFDNENTIFSDIMKQITSSKAALIAVGILATAIIVAGCSSSGYQKGAATGASLQKASQRIANTQMQLDGALSALTDLTSNPGADLLPQFKSFTVAVSRLTKSSESLSAASAKIQTLGQAYFEKWDQQAATIQNEDIRSRSVARKAEVSERFDRIRANYEKARTSFTPLISDLNDIQRALSTDLTADGIKAVAPLATKANQSAQPLHESLGKLAEDFSALGTAMSQNTAVSK